MTIKLHRSLATFSSVCEIIETDSFRACSFAMDDGGRCLLDVISDPLLLQSFLESGSDDNSKDPQDGTSSESAVESPQIARYSQVSLSNHVSSLENVIEPSDQQMGYSYPIDGQGLLAHNSACSIGVSLGGGTAVIVGSPSTVPAFPHASTSRATIHHLPASVSQSSLHQHSSVPPRPLTPLSHNIKSPGQGSPSVHMPPPSPLQQTRSPLTSHTPSPAPAWSPAPPVLSPATSRAQCSMPSVAFQPHNQMLQTTANVTQIVTALSQQNQKLNMQSQTPLIIHSQTSPIPSPQQPTRLTMTSPVVTTASVSVAPPMVQIISAPQANVPLPIRTPHSTVRPIQPKLPQQILPKPANSATSQFVAPVKQTNNTPVTASQRGVSVPLQTAPTSQLVIGQGQPSMFSSPQGTIVLNSIIPGMGQSPILIQGNLGNLTNLPGLQLTLRPPVSATTSQALSSSGAQNNPTLIAALQGPNQPAQALFTQTKSSLHGQQTIVIPNNIASTGLQQNLNLAQTAIRNNTIVPSVSQGQGILGRSNIILSSRLVGPNQGLQLQQIQTPQGPILALASSGTISLPHALQNATLGASQLTSGTLPLQGVVATGQGVISHLSLPSQHAALHHHAHQHTSSLFSATVPLTGQIDQSTQGALQLPQNLSAQHITASLPASHSSAIHLQQHLHSHQENLSPKPPSPPKHSKAPSVNLEELLKEHGIVPENTPPPSPESQSPQSEDPVRTQIQVHSPIVPSPHLIAAALQPQHHVVLEQLSQGSMATSALPQMKLALAQDGSVIIHPHHAFIPTSRFSHNPAPTKIASTISTAVLPNIPNSMSLPVVTTQHCTSQNHSALLARLNSAPAMGLPEVVTSLALSTNFGSSTTSSITTPTLTTTAPVLIPLTVPSFNVSHSPVTTSHIVQPVTSISSVISGQIPIELCSSLPQSVNHTSHTSMQTVLTQQNISNRLNHMIFGIQPLITPNQQISSAISSVVKSVSEPVSIGMSSLKIPEVAIVSQSEKVYKPDSVITIADSSSGTIAPGHKPQAITPVPNDISHIDGEHAGQVITVPVSSASQKNQTNITHTERESSSESQTNFTKTSPCHNTHLVNLLKQSPVHNLNVQPLAPAAASSTSQCDILKPSSVSQIAAPTKITTSVSFGTTQQKHATQHTSVSPENSQGNDNQRPASTAQQPATCAPKHNMQYIKGKQPSNRISSASKSALINKQLSVDQNYAVSPDINTPFASKRDACNRLLKYHVYNSKVPSVDEMATADEMFEKVSIQLLDKFQKMMNKYHLLQLKDSMKPCPTPECVLLERLFQEDEKAALDDDKASVAEGIPLVLPPIPTHWLKDWNAPSSSRSSRDGSSSPDKDDSDNLEAPIIDSCIDPASPQSDMGDRSPPTLKRIVVKKSFSPERELDESCSKKRLKIQNSPKKTESNTSTWCSAGNVKLEQKVDMSTYDKTFPLKAYDRFHCDNKDEDIITKLRKELNISPLENGDSESVVPHVDFETPECANGLADFDPPVARTESVCESTLTYNNCARTNHEIKYDFDMLGCPSDWVDDYTNHVSHNTAESQAAVESILSDHHNQSELDLSDIEGLDDHLDDSQQSIPNGIRDDDDSDDSELQYIPYSIPKNRSITAEVEGHSNEVQSAIKSILELQSDNRSYFDADDSDIMPRLYELEKTSHDSRKHCHMSPASYVSLDGDIGMNSETDAALEEAVQSILQ